MGLTNHCRFVYPSPVAERKFRPDPIPDDARLGDVPPPTRGLWPDPDEGPWRVSLYWGRVAGRIVCVGMELTSVPNPDPSLILEVYAPDAGEPEHWGVSGWPKVPTPLTTSVLRKLNLSSLVDASLEGLSQYHQWWATIQEDRRREIAKRAAELEQAGKAKPRQTRLTPAYFGEVAMVYEEAYRAGINPTQAVASRFDKSKSTAAKYVMKARELRFLGPTEQGKAGGVGDNPETEGS